MKKRKEALQKWMVRYAPPGLSVGTEWGIYAAGMVLSVLYSFGFLWRYQYALKLVDGTDFARPYYKEGMPLVFWEDVFGSAMGGFFLLSVVVLAYVIRHYLYYVQESRSIYTMQRLGRPLELHKRALIQPAVMLLLLAVVALILWFVYYQIYRSCPLEQFVTQEQWNHLWY